MDADKTPDGLDIRCSWCDERIINIVQMPRDATTDAQKLEVVLGHVDAHNEFYCDHVRFRHKRNHRSANVRRHRKQK